MTCGRQCQEVFSGELRGAKYRDIWKQTWPSWGDHGDYAANSGPFGWMVGHMKVDPHHSTSLRLVAKGYQCLSISAFLTGNPPRDPKRGSDPRRGPGGRIGSARRQAPTVLHSSGSRLRRSRKSLSLNRVPVDLQVIPTASSIRCFRPRVSSRQKSLRLLLIKPVEMQLF